MTALTEHQRHIRVTINGVVVKTSDDVSITESIDNLCTVCEFSLSERPATEPVEGDDVLVQWINIDGDLVYDYFGGTISAIDVESEPWAMLIRCVDQLELLRKIKTGSDLIFGEPDGTPAMTEGEAVMAVLDYCGVTYDPLDIADSGYVLGERERVSWLNDLTTSGAQIVAEFNRVFRMSLFTIGNNRVIRLPYDPFPNDATGLYATYTKGTSINFQAHHRTHGDRDRVQNVWVVRGVTAESSNSCTATPWAKSSHGALLVGISRRTRVAQQEFQSDLIQDEALAEAIVRSLMGQTNRLPDEGTATLAFDPNVHQCSKIAIIDGTYGITANPRYFLVRAKSATGPTMSLDLVAGPGGNEGTVTHGVDKVCGDVHTDPDWPGDFDWPDFDFPPLDLGDPIDFSFPDFGLGFDIVGGELDALPAITCDSAAYSDALPIEADSDWQLSGVLTLTNTNQRLRIGVTSDDGEYVLTIAGPGYYDGLPAEPERYEMTTPTALRHMIGGSPLNTPITWLLRWTDTTSTLQCQVSTGDFVVDDFAVYAGATMANAATTSTVSGTPTRASETVLHNCNASSGPGGGCMTPVGTDWDDQGTTVTFGTGNVTFADGSEAGAIVLIDPAVITDDQQVTWSVHVEFSGPGDGVTDVPVCDFGLYQTNPTGPGSSVNVEWSSITGDGFIYLYGFGAGFHQENITAAEIYGGFDLSIVWNPVANTVSYTFDPDSGPPITNSVALDAEVGHDLQLRMAFASGTALSMTTTAHEICIDNAVLIVENWVEDSNPGNHTFGDGYDHIDTEGAAHNTSVSKGLGDAWTLTGTISPSTVNSTQLGMGADGLSFEYYLLIYATSEGGGLEVGSLADDTFDATDLSASGTVDVTLAYDGIDTLTATFDGGGGPIVISTTTDDVGFPPAVPLYVGVRCYTTAGGGADFDSLELLP